MHFLDPAKNCDPTMSVVRLGIEKPLQALKSEVVKVFLTGNLRKRPSWRGASGVVAVGHYYGDELEWLPPTAATSSLPITHRPRHGGHRAQRRLAAMTGF